MHDILTSSEIAKSVRGGLMKFVKLAEDATEFETYVRRSLLAGDYRKIHRKSKRMGGDVPEWERAYALFVSTRDFLRALNNRARDGRLRRAEYDEKEHAPVNPESLAACTVKVLPTLPPESEPEPKSVDLVIRNADVAGYVYDPSWVNGGLAGFRPEHRPAQPERDLRGVEPFKTDDKPIAAREPVVQGVAAFGSVADADCGGIPEIAWFFCGADFELGIASWLDGVTTMALTGGSPGESNGTSPKGPGDLARLAAAEHRRILGIMSRLAPRHERALRTAYTDTRCPRQLVTDYGAGLALVVWKAQQHAGEAGEHGTYLAPGQGTLARLVELVRADWPEFEGSVDGASEELDVRIARSADLVLWIAHERYRIEAARLRGPSALERASWALAAAKRSKSFPGSLRVTPKIPPRKKKPKRRPDLVAKGAIGRLRRQLIEARPANLPIGGEPRAA